MRIRWLAALALSTALLLSGCVAPADGIVSIGRALDGTLWVYVRTCHHPMSVATLFWPDDPNNKNSANDKFARWSIAKQPDPLRASWPLLGPGANGVVATEQLTEIPGPPKNMSIGAGTKQEPYWAAFGPSGFTANDLAKLKPGQVLTTNDKPGKKEPPFKAVSLAEFDALDCSEFQDR